MRAERSDRKLWKTRIASYDEHPQAIAGPPAGRPPRRQQQSPQLDENDAEFRLALEASKYEEEERQRKDKTHVTRGHDEDDDLAKAIKLSKEEEEARRRELENQNAASLFDDSPLPSQPQATGYNQGYQQQPAVDWFGNPLQQPQNTGFLNNQYAQPTGYQNGYGFAPQVTGFPQQPNSFDQPLMLPQQTAFQNNNPYGQAPIGDMFGAQSPHQQLPQPGTNNPWASQSNQNEMLKPMATGSNNPFAQKSNQASALQQSRPQPSLGTLHESEPAATFAQPTVSNPIMSFQAPQHTARQTKQELDPQRARLNALLAQSDGMDTFGNTGETRIPSQHTAPGTFVNSAGGGMDRLRAAQTGTNPFFQPQATGFAPRQQHPTQTGPAGGYGQQNNPFGARPQQQSGSLIDL